MIVNQQTAAQKKGGRAVCHARTPPRSVAVRELSGQSDCLVRAAVSCAELRKMRSLPRGAGPAARAFGEDPRWPRNDGRSPAPCAAAPPPFTTAPTAPSGLRPRASCSTAGGLPGRLYVPHRKQGLHRGVRRRAVRGRLPGECGRAGPQRSHPRGALCRRRAAHPQGQPVPPVSAVSSASIRAKSTAAVRSWTIPSTSAG